MIYIVFDAYLPNFRAFKAVLGAKLHDSPLFKSQ